MSKISSSALLFLCAACSSRAAPGPETRAPEPRATGARDITPLAGMIAIPAGSFVRGKASSPRHDETPEQLVHVSAFRIDATLVTRRDFAAFVAETGYVTSAELAGIGTGAREGMEDWAWERIPQGSWRMPFRLPDDASTVATADAQAFLRDDAPVVMVSWEDAVAYCTHSKKRLPTEAEWEFAMRAGAEKTRYPWGDSAEDESGKMRLNFWQGESHAKNDRTDGFVYVSPVKAFAPNRYGIYDPVGNVWQWTADWYAPDTYARAREVGDPRGAESGDARVLRGGSWWCGACTCEGNGLTYRGKASPKAAFNNNGFRCATDATR
jgi:formylglycine-generating enzyme required for sulfatase activity